MATSSVCERLTKSSSPTSSALVGEPGTSVRWVIRAVFGSMRATVSASGSAASRVVPSGPRRSELAGAGSSTVRGFCRGALVSNRLIRAGSVLVRARVCRRGTSVMCSVAGAGTTVPAGWVRGWGAGAGVAEVSWSVTCSGREVLSPEHAVSSATAARHVVIRRRNDDLPWVCGNGLVPRVPHSVVGL